MIRKDFDHQDLAEAQYPQLMVNKPFTNTQVYASTLICCINSYLKCVSFQVSGRILDIILAILFIESFYRGHRRTQSNTSNISSISRVSYNSEHYYDRALVRELNVIL